MTKYNREAGRALEWKAVKNLLLVLLLIMNVVLGFFNYEQYQQNVLTSSQERAIYEVLSQNRIILYTDLLTKFPPMRKLSLSAPMYSRDDMKQQFFANEESTITVEFNKTIITSETKVLTMEGNKGELVFKNGTNESQKMTLNEARKRAKEFVESFQKSNIEEFEIGNVQEVLEGYKVTFFQKYKGIYVFANCIEVYVGERGISRVKLNYFETKEFTGDKKDICFSDEVLLTFLIEIEKEREETGTYETITVQKMELGYDFQEMEDLKMDNVAKLVPCYRIYVLGREKPYVINAYTNEIIRKIKE